MDVQFFTKTYMRTKQKGQKKKRKSRSSSVNTAALVRQKERLREKKVNRQVQVRESKERQRSCSKWMERQRKIKENDEAAAATHSTTGFDLGDKDTGPRQVKLKSYPHDTFGTQKRAFNHSWFEKHNWLEYSVNQNAAFCFPCRVFGKNIKHDSLVSSGCKNWKKALVIFVKHEMAQTHKDSVVTWKSYQGTSKQGNVAQMIAAANVSEIVERREYLRRIVAVTSMLGRQGLPFRGHDEGEDSPNRGNFLACMELLKEFDPFLQKHNPPSNAQYISPTSQNDMIDCCAQEVTIYAIMADEARDEKAEQLAVYVRYVSEGAVKVSLHLQR
ncbi:hypothetical protein ACER0C_001443 [Sarotherodon galilaeus]